MKSKKAKKPAAKSAKRKQKEGARAPSAQNLITKDMTFGEVLQRFPKTFPIFAKYGMHCIGCSMSAYETIEQGAKAHGIDVKKFVDDLNKAATSK